MAANFDHFLRSGLVSAMADQKYNGHIDDVANINNEILETNREMIAVLKEINQTLKDKN